MSKSESDVKPTLDSVFRDVPDLDTGKAGEISKDREKRKSRTP